MAVGTTSGRTHVPGVSTSTSTKATTSTAAHGLQNPHTPVADMTPVKSFSAPNNGAGGTMRPVHTAMPSDFQVTEGSQIKTVAQDSGGGGASATQPGSEASDAVAGVQRPQGYGQRLTDMINEFVQADNPIMRYARQRGYEDAAARGLNNSSIASGTAEQVALGEASTLAQKAFDAENSQYQHEQTLANQSAVSNAQIDKIRAEINEMMVTTNADGAPSTVSADRMAEMDGYADTAFSNFSAAVDQAYKNFPNDGASAARAVRQARDILRGRLQWIYRGTGVDIDSIMGGTFLTQGMYAPPRNRNWQTSSASQIISGWRGEGMSYQDVERAIQWAFEQGHINLVKQQELLTLAKQQYGM